MEEEIDLQLKIKFIAEIKSFEEIFPEIDLRVFESKKTLEDVLFNIEITVDGVTYNKNMYEGKKVEILVSSEEDLEKLDTVFVTAENSKKFSIKKDWLKNIKTDKYVEKTIYQKDYSFVWKNNLDEKRSCIDDKLKNLYESLYGNER